jgi:hypothetical protein
VGSNGPGLLDKGLWPPTTVSTNIRPAKNLRRYRSVSVLRQPLLWIAAAIILIGAVMLVADVRAAGLWVAVITIGIAVVVVDAYRRRQAQHHG